MVRGGQAWTPTVQWEMETGVAVAGIRLPAQAAPGRGATQNGLLDRHVWLRTFSERLRHARRGEQNRSAAIELNHPETRLEAS